MTKDLTSRQRRSSEENIHKYDRKFYLGTEEDFRADYCSNNF